MRLPACRSLLVLCLLAASSGVLRADRIVLDDGTEMRGIDLKKRGDTCTFTLENGHVVAFPLSRLRAHEPSPPGETVDFRGEQVSLRAKVRTLVREERARERRVLRDLGRWARGGRDADEAKARFAALTEREQERYLGRALAASETPRVRALAVDELAHLESEHARSSLVAAAIDDAAKEVRDVSLAALGASGDEDVALAFVPYLKSPALRQRFRASEALAAIPDRRAVPQLIETLRYTWAGFGRAFTFQGTQRAYVSDYELVSGGTGFSLVEVADPVISTSTTGVSLDADVRKVELIRHTRTLQAISGRDFGPVVADWEAWWAEEEKRREKEEAEAQEG